MPTKEPAMSDEEVVKVALPSELLESIREAVEAGEYATTGEVIREALNEWRLRQAEIERLRTAWQDGIRSGGSVALDIEAVKSAARRRFAQRSADR
jgi:antitoxin ParD1/3/4